MVSLLRPGINRIIALGGANRLVAIPAIDGVVALEAVDDIIAGIAVNGVVAVVGVQVVSGVATVEVECSLAGNFTETPKSPVAAAAYQRSACFCKGSDVLLSKACIRVLIPAIGSQ